MITKLRRLTAASDEGITLVELLVAMFISSVLLALVATMFVNIARVTTNADATTQRGGTAANVMNELSKVIRTTANNAVAGRTADPAIISATASALTVYSFVDTNPTRPAPTKVAFHFDSAGKLIEDRWAASASGSYWVFSGTAVTRTLGGPLVTSVTPLFTYLDEDGAVINPGTGSLSLDQRTDVASILLTVTIANRPTTGDDPIILTKTVNMPNLKISGTTS